MTENKTWDRVKNNELFINFIQNIFSDVQSKDRNPSLKHLRE